MTSAAQRASAAGTGQANRSPNGKESDHGQGRRASAGALADIDTVSLERTELDPASLIAVRLAALVAVDAPVSSTCFTSGPRRRQG
jgi:predicted nuclease with RNAse H fold